MLEQIDQIMEWFADSMKVMVLSRPFFTFPFIIFWVIINWFLAQVAAYKSGSAIYWFVGFMFLPVISHIYFIVVYIRVITIERKRSVRKGAVIEPGSGPGWIKQLNPVEGIAVKLTPFDEVEPCEVGDTSGGVFGVSEQSRDSELDTLIELKEWERAREYAEKQIAQAGKSGDKVNIERYEAYLEVLKHATPKQWGPKAFD